MAFHNPSRANLCLFLCFPVFFRVFRDQLLFRRIYRYFRFNHFCGSWGWAW